jgi:hypothetical protein
MKRRVLGVSASLLLLGLLPGTAAAAATVDQSNEVKTFAGSGALGQTFTVGRAGLLTAVDLRLGGVPANVEVYLETQVRATGMPSDVKLATVAGSIPSTEQWVNFQFATPVAVLVGSRLAIVVNIDYPGTAVYSDDTYAGGTGVVHYATGWASQPLDLDFRTYVDSAAPTAAPTLPPTKAPTLPPTKAPTAAPTAAPTLPAPESSASGLATPTPGTSTGPSASPVSSPDASAGPLTDPQSGGSGGLPVPIVVALILAVGMALGGLGFAVGRRPRASA